jgi:hypothetical protein
MPNNYDETLRAAQRARVAAQASQPVNTSVTPPPPLPAPPPNKTPEEATPVLGQQPAPKTPDASPPTDTVIPPASPPPSVPLNPDALALYNSYVGASGNPQAGAGIIAPHPVTPNTLQERTRTQDYNAAISGGKKARDIVDAIKADPDKALYDMSNLSQDSKERLFALAGKKYTREIQARDLRNNYITVGTPGHEENIPRKQYDDILAWAKDNKLDVKNIKDVLDKGGIGAFNILMRQYGEEKYYEALRLTRKQQDSWEKTSLPGLPKDLQEAYYKGKLDGNYKEFDKLIDKYNEEYQAFIDEYIKSDEYLSKILAEKGEDAAIDALNKRNADLTAIYQRQTEKFVEWLNKEAPAELREAYEKGGLEGYERAYIIYQRSMDAGYAIADEAYTKNLKENYPGLYRVYNRIGPEKYKELSEELAKDHPDADILAEFLSPKEREVYDDLKNAGAKFSLLQGAGILPEDSTKMSGQINGKPEISWGQDFTSQLMQASPGGFLILGAEMLVPGVYLGRHWKELSNWEKGLYIVLDAAAVLPIFTAASGAARSVSTAGKLLRMQIVAKTLIREGVAQIVSPVTMLFHPVKSAKGFYRSVRDTVELLAHPKRLSEFVVTTANKTIHFKPGMFRSEAEAMRIRDELVMLAARGEKVVIETKDFTLEMPRSPLMRELGGGTAHVSPDVEALVESGKVKYKPGFPKEEQGLFFGAEAPVEFVSGSAFGKGVVPVATTATDTVIDISKYRVNELVMIDKSPVRSLDFANAKNVPADLARDIQDYTRKNSGVLYGSMNEYTKINKAKVPNDLDLVFQHQNKAIDDIIDLAKKRGYKARRAPHAVEIFKDGEWIQIADIANFPEHKAMIPAGLSEKVLTRIDGVLTETMGEQYLRQSYGSVSKTAKASTRAERVNAAAKEVKKMLQEAGVSRRKPGILFTSEKLAPSNKLYHGQLEMEGVIKVGEDIPKPKQKLFTRIGNERVEIYLDKKLSPYQIAKLKAEGLVEVIKAPFKEPIKVTEWEGALLAEDTFKDVKLGKDAESANDIIRDVERELKHLKASPVMSARVINNVREVIKSRGIRNVSVDDIRTAFRNGLRTRLTNRKELQHLARTLERAGNKRQAEYLRDIDNAVIVPPSPRSFILPSNPTDRGKVSPPPPDRGKVSPPPPDRGKVSPPPPDRGKVPPPPPDRGKVPPPPPDRGKVPPPPPDRGKVPPPPPDRGKSSSDGGSKGKKEWTKEEFKAALKWKDGFVIHALKPPFRPKIDAKSYDINHLPDGFVASDAIEIKGAGSQQATARVTKDFPRRLTVDVGNQDVLVVRKGRNRVTMRHSFDRTNTRSQATIQQRGDSPQRGHNMSKKQGRIYKGKVGRSTVFSHQPIKGY